MVFENAGIVALLDLHSSIVEDSELEELRQHVGDSDDEQYVWAVGRDLQGEDCAQLATQATRKEGRLTFRATCIIPRDSIIPFIWLFMMGSSCMSCRRD